MLIKSRLQNWYGRLHSDKFSGGWVLKIWRWHLYHTVQRLRNMSEWIRLKAGVYREMLFARSREEQQSLLWPGHFLHSTKHFAVHSCCICLSICFLSSRWTNNHFPWNGTIAVSFYFLQNVLYTLSCFLTNQTQHEKKDRRNAWPSGIHIFWNASHGWVGCCGAWRPGAILICAHLSY